MLFSDPLFLPLTEQDKWRNLSVTAYGWGSRDKGRVALKRTRQIAKHDATTMALSTVVKDVENEIVDVPPLAVSTEPLYIAGPKKTISRLCVFLILHCFVL